MFVCIVLDISLVNTHLLYFVIFLVFFKWASFGLRLSYASSPAFILDLDLSLSSFFSFC